MAQTAQLVVRTESGLRVRPEPARLSLCFTDLVASDGHTLRCNLALSIRAMDRPAELQLLVESLMGGAADVTLRAVSEHFEPALRAAAVDAARKRGAEDHLTEAGKNSFADALLEAAKRLAFTCGLEVLPPCQIDLESPSLARQRILALQRQAEQQRQADRMQQLEKTAEMLKRFAELRQTTPELTTGQLLASMGSQDGAAMLQGLMMAAAQQGQSTVLLAAAGPALMSVDLRAPAGALAGNATTITPPAALGPLRSVSRNSDGTIMLGARSGVHLIDERKSAEPVGYADSTILSQMGFNKVVRWGGEIWASHSEAGLRGWSVDQPDRPDASLPPAKLNGAAPRNLMVLDDSRLLFTSGPRLHVLHRKEDEFVLSVAGADAPADIIAVLPLGVRLLVVLQNGVVQYRDLDSLDIAEERTVASNLSAATLLPWLDGSRLLVAEESGRLLCLGLEDGLVTTYFGPYTGYRVVVAAADRVAALTSDRQRIVLWNSAEPSRPASDLHVMSLARHRATDLAM